MMLKGLKLGLGFRDLHSRQRFGRFEEAWRRPVWRLVMGHQIALGCRMSHGQRHGIGPARLIEPEILPNQTM